MRNRRIEHHIQRSHQLHQRHFKNNRQLHCRLYLVSIKLNFNGDTGTNYNLLYAYNGQGNIGGGTPIVTGELTQQTSMDIGNMIATQSGGGLYPNSGTVIVASIPGYASGFYKTVQCNGDELSDPNEQDFFDGTWFSTAKISTVTIAPSRWQFRSRNNRHPKLQITLTRKFN